MTFEVHLSPNKYNDILLIPSSFAEKEANPTLYIDVFVSPILTTHSLILSINYSLANKFTQSLNHHSLLHCNSITRFLTGCCWSVDMDCPLCSPPFIFCASLRISSCNSIIYEYRHTMYVRTDIN